MWLMPNFTTIGFLDSDLAPSFSVSAFFWRRSCENERGRRESSVGSLSSRGLSQSLRNRTFFWALSSGRYLRRSLKRLEAAESGNPVQSAGMISQPVPHRTETA